MMSTRTLEQARGWDGSSLGMGTFDIADPLGFAAGDTNLFRYVGNTPTDDLDPLGLGKQEQKNWKNYQNDPAEAVKYPGPDIGHPGYKQLLKDATADNDVLAELCASLTQSRNKHKEIGGFILWNPTTGDYEVTHSGVWPDDEERERSHVHWPKRRANGDPIAGSGYVPVIWFHTHPNTPGPSPGDKDVATGKLNQIPLFIIFNPNGVCYTGTKKPFLTLKPSP